MQCCIPTHNTDSNTSTGMIWVTLNMPSATEECCKPSGNCQGISHCLESGVVTLNLFVLKKCYVYLHVFISHSTTRLPVAQCLTTEFISLAKAAVQSGYFLQLLRHHWTFLVFLPMWNIFSQLMPGRRLDTTRVFICRLSTFQNQLMVCL